MMIAVIFEVEILDDKKEQYLDLGAQLRPELEKMAGFISIERFQSLNNKGKILSLSFWENEESVTIWRNLETHRLAQTVGRQEIFKNYRLRVLHVLRDYGMDHRKEAPLDSAQYHS